jgi:nucleotide-binding universal stress UspA family protein
VTKENEDNCTRDVCGKPERRFICFALPEMWWRNDRRHLREVQVFEKDGVPEPPRSQRIYLRGRLSQSSASRSVNEPLTQEHAFFLHHLFSSSRIVLALRAPNSDYASEMASKESFTRILLAVDGSEVSLRAATRAARIAKQDGAELIALHVVPTPPFEVPGELADYYDAARKNAKKWMREVENIATAHGLGLKSEILVGAYSVVDAIIAYAETLTVDLIVSGTRGKTPSTRMRMGSVASGLVEYSNCAVLIIR